MGTQEKIPWEGEFTIRSDPRSDLGPHRHLSWRHSRGVFSLFFSGFNLYCWKGIHFSWNLDLIFLHLFFGLIIGFHFWLRDLLREFYKKYEILLIIFFLVFLLFLASEALLFVSFFWGSFHSLSSPSLGIWAGEGFYVPDPCELTFANTLLLSNAAVSLGGAFVSLEISSSFLIFFSL